MHYEREVCCDNSINLHKNVGHSLLKNCPSSFPIPNSVNACPDPYSRAAKGVKNLWATKVSGNAFLETTLSGPHHSTPYLIEDNLRNKSMLRFSGPLHFHRKSLNNALFESGRSTIRILAMHMQQKWVPFGSVLQFSQLVSELVGVSF